MRSLKSVIQFFKVNDMGTEMRKVVAITGALGILGAAVGQAFAAAGWRVALIDVTPSTTSEQGESLLLEGVDLSNLQQACSAFDTVVEYFGQLDALVNVAGGFRWETLQDGSLDTWDLMYKINLRTTATAIKAALGHLLHKNGARVINIAAASAFKAGAGMGAYAASKAGVMRLTEALAEEHKRAD
jgi:NAD(P)-dependent dehydrogenase (short-subunit alcohol dehydrogenase family)